MSSQTGDAEVSGNQRDIYYCSIDDQYMSIDAVNQDAINSTDLASALE
jgi:hypothetical protein